MAKTTASACAPGKYSLTPSTADKFAGTPEQRGVAAPPPIKQVLGTGTMQAWKSRLPVPSKRISGGGTAGKGAASKGATATGLSNLPVPPPRSISGGASKLPVPIRKTPGETSRLPAPSLKTPKDATVTPKKPIGPTRAPLMPRQVQPRQVPKTGVASPSGNRVSELTTKTKSPTPTNTKRTANDTARVSYSPKTKPSSSTPRKPSLSPVRGTAGVAAAPKGQNRQPPPNPVPATVITPITTPIAPAVVPITPVVPRHVFVPLPSTYPHGVKVCEGECLKPLPTELQKAAGAIHLERRRHKFAQKPGRPWLRAKRIVAPGEYYKRKPLPGPSPLKKCLSEKEVVTRRKIIRVKGKVKVVAPHLGPKGRPRTFEDQYKCPLAIGLLIHRRWLMEKGRSPWWGYLRELKDGT